MMQTQLSTAPVIDSIHLRGAGGAVRIDVESLGMVRCWLAGEPPIYLGAEPLVSLVDRIVNGFDDDGAANAGALEGHRVRCILPLRDGHHTLYMAHPDAGYLLYWQDPHARTIARIALCNFEKQDWIDTLEKLKIRVKRRAPDE